MKEQQEEGSFRNFTEEEISMIEQELNKKMYADVPNEIEICMIARELQEKIGVISSLDLVAYLKKKFNKVGTQGSSSGVTQKPQFGTIFKQFAQVKIEQKMEDQPRQSPFEEPKTYTCRSKRKIRPAELVQRRNLEQLVEHMDNNTNDCHILLEKKSRKGNQVRQSIGQLQENCTWAYNQYFYAVFDKGFLKDEENFKRILEQIRLNPELATYYDHKALRVALPKPNLFNNEFIIPELQRLASSRNQARIPKQQRGRGQLQLSVGRQVIAVHPICGHLHAGSILAIYKQNQYMVKFFRPELGTRRIIDTNIALKQISHPHKVITDNVNYEAMSLTIKLLQYKADLIKTLQRYNDIAQQAQRQKTQLGNVFFQQYGWVGSTINILSLGLKHILSKFRVRGLDQMNQEKIGRNFPSVLLNPLNLMDKQLQKSLQHSDINASQQIKKIISSFKQTKVQQYTKQLFSRYWSSLKTSDWSQQQRYEYQLLLKSLVGVLASLKIQHKHFSIEQNKYFKDLMGHFDNGYSEYFNQIYELLTSIVNKLIDEAK